MNLRYLKNQEKFIPKTILDIGCNIGKFHKQCRNVWGSEFFAFLIDGNVNVHENLDKMQAEELAKGMNFGYRLTLLSNEVKEVDFYTEKINPKGTGASYYRENTRHYTDDKITVEKKQTDTLDNIFSRDEKPCNFDFIKIDTQGSEIDIMRGGKNLMQKAKYVLLEVSHIEYNLGSPMMKDTDGYMKSIGFQKLKVIDNRKNEKGILIQSDIIYKNTHI